MGQSWEPLEILTPEEMGEGSPDIVIENGKIHIVSVGRDTMAVWYRFWEPDTYVEDIDKPENISLLKQLGDYTFIGYSTNNENPKPLVGKSPLDYCFADDFPKVVKYAVFMLTSQLFVGGE